MLGQAAAALRGAEPRPVAFHPTCHLEIVEEAGYGHLQDLKATLVGHRDDLIGLPDLEALGPPLGAVLLELPQRELGGLVGAVLAGPARRT